ncbi:protein asteroid [Bradysia coprophila]|uniref:protein asteroid n=1 Tax=Bradysia coprophila TaxID=38358 RepID=UPI00187D7B5E|nr:protein asteroid [Bradysia coprophila]XP_037042415.1 protein asteroid [Bradysia coprophila]
MGVRGLTSYIAQNAEKYLEPYELHDCDLVIDGDSLASNLYSWHSQCNSAFGGDYDQYFRCVVNFFAMLEKCNVTPYVLLDGGYERKKLETVRQRLRSKIGAVKHINPFRCIPLFPLMLREVFVEAVKTTGCRLMRCLFEGDDEVSVLARKLKCPVLSYDSDFYIHNVLYIPSITVSFRVHKRKIPKKIRNKISPDEENPATYNFLDCCIYSVSNLVRNQLQANMLPLFATLLGNDYINGRLFRKFYANVSMKNIGKRSSPQQRRIVGLLRWLQKETVDSAIVKVLSRFEKEKRPWMLRQIDAAMGGYNREDSKAFDFFALEGVSPLCNSIENTYQISSDMDVDDDEEEIDEFIDSETDDDDDEMVGEGEGDKDEDGDDAESVEEEQAMTDNNEELQENALPSETSAEFKPPDWILQKVLAADVPRFIIDLLHLKLYVNSPQIENFVLNDSNEIALPILELIFTLLHYPEPNHFQYLTRVHRISNVYSKKIESIPLRTAFDPTQSDNIQMFGEIIENFERKFELIADLPENMRLFVLAMVYMSERNSSVAQPFYHSLLLGLLLMSKADEDVQPVTRDPRVLQKRYGSVLTESGTPKKPIKELVDRSDESMETVADSTGQTITTDDSVHFLRNVLPLFQISDKIREKHTDFSSTIVHTFAEFQAIVFNLNCLNSLLGKPFRPIFVSKSFNGTFLYNMYVNLRDRPNIDHFIRHHVFTDCDRYYHFYASILTVCKSMIPCLTDTVCDKSKKGKATRNYRRNRRKQKLKTVAGNRQDGKIADEAFDDVETEELKDGDIQFTDSNNKFATLLNCN